MTDRFLTLARYAAGMGADAILFTCSAFGPCIEACRAALPGLSMLKPNEAMIEEAQTYGQVGLLASFPATLASMPREFPSGMRLVTGLAEGALTALDEGDAKHDQLAAMRPKSLLTATL